MKLQDLKNELSIKYDLICFEDLSFIAAEHGRIFKLFKEHHRPEFLPNQRFVFYSAVEDIPQIVLDHLQYAAAKVDISNFFILVCTPVDMTHKLAVANKAHGYDSQDIGYLQFTLKSSGTFDRIGIHPRTSMCPLPFGALSASADAFTICCKINQSLPNDGTKDFNVAFNDPKIVHIRQQIKQGIKAPECQTCWASEDLGSTSLRLHALDKFGDACDTEWIDDPKIRAVDINISSLCNFKCRICEPRASSQWAVEELKFEPLPSKVQELRLMLKKNTESELQKHFGSLLPVTPGLEYLHVMGGEPFMLPVLDDLIDHLVINNYAQHLHLEFNTNGSMWPEKVISQLEKFKKIEILLSVDNVGSRFEIERGGYWPDVESNLRKFANLKSNRVSVKLGVTVNIQNLLYLNDLMAFAQDLGLEIVWWYLEQPTYLSIDNVTQQVKDLTFAKYHNHVIEELANISNRLQQTPAIQDTNFVKRMDELDQRRQEKFYQTHQEIYLAMGGEYKDE